MSSGAAAQAAASQVATQSQADANRNALAFAKEVYNYEQQARNPYLQGGAAGMQEYLTLLGLGQNVAGIGLTGGGGSSSARTPAGPTQNLGGGNITHPGPAQNRQPTQDVFRPPPNAGGPPPSGPYQDWIRNEESLGGVIPGDVRSSPRDISTNSTVTMTAPDGTARLVPASLVPYFQERGLSVVG